MKSYTCEYCHSVFERRGKKKIPRYCSRACHDNARRKYTKTPCIQCGKPFLPNHKGHSHCSEECSHKTTQAKLSQKVTLTCKACGTSFERSPAQVGDFCSPECYFKAKQVTQERACDYCGKMYLPRAERSQKGCCSHDCAVAFRRQNSIRICEFCGDEYYPTKTNQRFCSNRCGNTAKRTPSYGRKRRTENFSPVRKQQIRKRDFHQCVLCQSTDRIQVDHILPVELGGKSTIENGQTLCHHCHVKKTTQDRAMIRKQKGLKF